MIGTTAGDTTLFSLDPVIRHFSEQQWKSRVFEAAQARIINNVGGQL